MFLPTKSWLKSWRRVWPWGGPGRTSLYTLSNRSTASFTLRSASTLCHWLLLRGVGERTFSSTGPFPTSKEKDTTLVATQGEKKPNKKIQQTYNGCDNILFGHIYGRSLQRQSFLTVIFFSAIFFAVVLS